MAINWYEQTSAAIAGGVGSTNLDFTVPPAYGLRSFRVVRASGDAATVAGQVVATSTAGVSQQMSRVQSWAAAAPGTSPVPDVDSGELDIRIASRNQPGVLRFILTAAGGTAATTYKVSIGIEVDGVGTNTVIS